MKQINKSYLKSWAFIFLHAKLESFHSQKQLLHEWERKSVNLLR